ncbi:hypothetical protein BU17DRAFT_83995 [Hysterangium stoloniferum]|nr:hypothetical protein BU17DRAFT_83995 [Hysterangium stoloniferum]
MTRIVFRPSVRSDGDTIISIMDANIVWFREIGSVQWGLKLFSENPKMAAYWKARAGVGDLLQKGKAQMFVIEITDGPERIATTKKVAGFYIVGKRCPMYVPKTDEPSLYIHNAVVYPAMRGRGIGAAIVNHAKELARKTEATVIRLDTYGGRLGTTAEGSKLINAWVKLGFHKSAQVTRNGGQPNDREPWSQILALYL